MLIWSIFFNGDFVAVDHVTRPVRLISTSDFAVFLMEYQRRKGAERLARLIVQLYLESCYIVLYKKECWPSVELALV